MNAQQYVESIAARLEASDRLKVTIERDEDSVYVFATEKELLGGYAGISAYRSAVTGRWNMTSMRYAWGRANDARKAKTRNEINAVVSVITRDWR